MEESKNTVNNMLNKISVAASDFIKISATNNNDIISFEKGLRDLGLGIAFKFKIPKEFILDSDTNEYFLSWEPYEITKSMQLLFHKVSKSTELVSERRPFRETKLITRAQFLSALPLFADAYADYLNKASKEIFLNNKNK